MTDTNKNTEALNAIGFAGMSRLLQSLDQSYTGLTTNEVSALLRLNGKNSQLGIIFVMILIAVVVSVMMIATDNNSSNAKIVGILDRFNSSRHHSGVEYSTVTDKFQRLTDSVEQHRTEYSSSFRGGWPDINESISLNNAAERRELRTYTSLNLKIIENESTFNNGSLRNATEDSSVSRTLPPNERLNMLSPEKEEPKQIETHTSSNLILVQ